MLQEVRWSCNGERNGRDGETQMKKRREGGREKGGGRAAVGRVLTELINELALRDKA